MTTEPGFQVGQVVRREVTLSLDDFSRFAQLSGDDNPIHVDPDFAARTRFGRPVSHGMLLYGLVCGLLGEAFPGAVEVSQQMMFPAPTYAGQRLAIRAELLALSPGNGETGPVARLATSIVAAGNGLVYDGQATLALPPLGSDAA